MKIKPTSITIQGKRGYDCRQHGAVMQITLIDRNDRLVDVFLDEDLALELVEQIKAVLFPSTEEILAREGIDTAELKSWATDQLRNLRNERS